MGLMKEAADTTSEFSKYEFTKPLHNLNESSGTGFFSLIKRNGLFRPFGEKVRGGLEDGSIDLSLILSFSFIFFSMKPYETHARPFLTLNISSIGTVTPHSWFVRMSVLQYLDMCIVKEFLKCLTHCVDLVHAYFCQSQKHFYTAILYRVIRTGNKQGISL